MATPRAASTRTHHTARAVTFKLSASAIDHVTTVYVLFATCSIAAAIAAALWLEEPAVSDDAAAAPSRSSAAATSTPGGANPTVAEEIAAVPRLLFCSAKGFLALVFYNALFGFATGVASCSSVLAAHTRGVVVVLPPIHHTFLLLCSFYIVYINSRSQ